MADRAGMAFNAGYDEDSIELYFRGYADKLPTFIYTCLEKLKAFDPTEHHASFKMKKNQWLKDRRNFIYEDPNDQLTMNLTKIITNGYTNKHLILEGENFDFEMFCNMSNQILKNGRHLWFLTGNISGKPNKI